MYVVGMLDSINNNTEYIGEQASWKTFFENKIFRHWHMPAIELITERRIF